MTTTQIDNLILAYQFPLLPFLFKLRQVDHFKNSIFDNLNNEINFIEPKINCGYLLSVISCYVELQKVVILYFD